MSKRNKDSILDYKSEPLDKIVNYLVSYHHAYVVEQTPKINRHFELAEIEFAGLYPELVELKMLFENLSKDLIKHMKKEEQILFPYIKNLALLHRENLEFNLPIFKTVKNPIKMMELEHQSVSDDIIKLTVLSNNFLPPKRTGKIGPLLFNELKDFSEDFYRHIEIEDGILFPRAVQLEQKFTKFN